MGLVLGGLVFLLLGSHQLVKLSLIFGVVLLLLRWAWRSALGGLAWLTGGSRLLEWGSIRANPAGCNLVLHADSLGLLLHLLLLLDGLADLGA